MTAFSQEYKMQQVTIIAVSQNARTRMDGWAFITIGFVLMTHEEIRSQPNVIIAATQ
jgi:hypothetical protein